MGVGYLYSTYIGRPPGGGGGSGMSRYCYLNIVRIDTHAVSYLQPPNNSRDKRKPGTMPGQSCAVVGVF